MNIDKEEKKERSKKRPVKVLSLDSEEDSIFDSKKVSFMDSSNELQKRSLFLILN